ncbi:peroxiredoxin [Trichloromonas sp.]|uniref:peroxiredoxin n=1 Tax=Trichloromonas sp. TaxID=3069249 RepID=UPI002A38F8E7|nr:peroxiredoxin [Trichloromonas sp.]
MALLEGQPAPDFSLAGSDGNFHSLRDYAGHTLVVYFYPKDNTSGCTKEACAFRDLHKELRAMDVVLLGVSKDGMASHDQFIARFGLPFVLLSDPDTHMMRAYGAFGEKKMYGKVSQGTIRSTVIIGPDGTIVKHWPKVKSAEAHPAEVLAYLRSR